MRSLYSDFWLCYDKDVINILSFIWIKIKILILVHIYFQNRLALVYNNKHVRTEILPLINHRYEPSKSFKYNLMANAINKFYIRIKQKGYS